MEQIASGAEEAASASQETLAVATSTAATLSRLATERIWRAAPDRALQGAAGRDLESDRRLGDEH